MRFSIIFLAMCILSCYHGQSQEFINFDLMVNDVAERQNQFEHWSQSRNLDDEKGWKWYARWLEEQIQHSNSRGSSVDQTAYFHAANDVASQKLNGTRTTNESWIPVGPAVFPRIPGGNLFRGMGRINTIAFHPTDANTFWVGVAQGGVWKTTDAGQHWTPLTDDLPILRISDIAVDPNDGDVLYISIGDYAYIGVGLDADGRKRNTHYGLGVYKSVDGGMNWMPTGLTYNQLDQDASLIRRVGVHPQASDQLVAVGVSGVFTSADGGETWMKTLDEVMSDLEFDPTNPNRLYAASQFVESVGIGRAALWKSEDFGQTWVELNSGINSSNARRIELAIAPSNADVIYAIACNRNGGLLGFYQSTNGGVSWSEQSTSPNILHWYAGTSDGGQGTYDLGIMVHATDENIVYAGGVNMWGSEDGGVTWKRASFWLPQWGPSLHADHHYYKHNPVDGHYYVCHDGGVNRSRQIDLFTVAETNEAGFQLTTQWEDLSAGMEITSFYRMDVSRVRPNSVVAGAQDNSNFIKHDDDWINTVLGDGMDCLFHPTHADIAYVSTQGGRLVRTDNGGESFGFTLTNTIRSAETGGWTTPFEQDPSNPDGIYGAFGNVWHSANRGENWTRLTDFNSIPNSDFILPSSTLSIAPTDANRFYVAKRIYPTFELKGSMWTSADGGQTLENITAGLPDYLYISASTVSDVSPEHIWVTLAGFEDGAKVFWSTDAGQNWLNISYNLPNVPVNAIEFLKGSFNNEIYIGTDVGIYVLNDDVIEWQLFSHGLPNVIITDLVMDEINEEIYASTFGRGIWKSNLGLISSTTDLAPEKFNLALSPNPNQGTFKIYIGDGYSSSFTLEVFDSNGRRIWIKEFESHNKSIPISMNLDFHSGLYFLKIDDKKMAQVQKFIVK